MVSTISRANASDFLSPRSGFLRQAQFFGHEGKAAGVHDEKRVEVRRFESLQRAAVLVCSLDGIEPRVVVGDLAGIEKLAQPAGRTMVFEPELGVAGQRGINLPQPRLVRAALVDRPGGPSHDGDLPFAGAVAVADRAGQTAARTGVLRETEDRLPAPTADQTRAGRGS